MTYRELFYQDHADMEHEDAMALLTDSCPQRFYYAIVPDYCQHVGADCNGCWNREIPEELKSILMRDLDAEMKKVHALVAEELEETSDFTIIDIPADGSYVEILGHRITGDFKTFEGFLEYIRDLETTKREYEKLMATPTNAEVSFVEKGPGCVVPIIKDSGNRRQFESGAVRDMCEGKGRCDLMPLEVVARMFSENSMFEDPIIRGIKLFMSNDNDTEYLYHTLVVFCGKQYDGFAPTMLLEVAKHFEEGAKKYGENNWQKGIPPKCYIDSAVRHYLKWLRGDKDEPHDRAFVWNLMCCIWEVDYRTEGKTEECVKKEVPAGEAKLLPVTKAPEMVRLGDCITGLFDFGGETYLKLSGIDAYNLYVNVLTGTVRELHPDILVTPLEIWKADDGTDD